MIHFSQNGRIRNKNDVKNDIFSWCFDGLDTGSKVEEYGEFVFLFNRELSLFVIVICDQ